MTRPFEKGTTRNLPPGATVVAVCVLPLTGSACAVDIGSMEAAGTHGVDLVSGDIRLILQAIAAWGGYQDTAPQRLSIDAFSLAAPLPVSGYWRERWNLVAPHNDHFSARFTTRLTVEREGRYTFHLQSDDGARMWVDDQQIINDWIPRSNLTSEATVQLAVGEHHVRCEYMEISGQAQAHLRWSGPGIDEQVVPASVTSAAGRPGWRAEYYLNERVEGEAAVDHHDVLDLNWGDGGLACPARLTVRQNGTMILDDVELQGATGGAWMRT